MADDNLQGDAGNPQAPTTPMPPVTETTPAPATQEPATPAPATQAPASTPAPAPQEPQAPTQPQ